MAKCRAIVTYIHKSAQALEQLHEYELEMISVKLGVVQDVAGRWSSTFLMLSRLVRIKEPLIKTLKTMQRRDLLLSSTEWNTVTDLITALEPFSLLTVNIVILLLTCYRNWYLEVLVLYFLVVFQPL